MVDDARRPLGFDAVVRRFAESAETLTDVRNQLSAMIQRREAEESATASLQETAEHVSQFAAEAATILKGLEEAQAKVVDVLTVGADLLDGTELKAIAETVKENSRAISGIDGRIDALDTKVTELISAVASLQTAMEQDVDGLHGKLETIHEDVKTPIVKRLF